MNKPKELVKADLRMMELEVRLKDLTRKYKEALKGKLLGDRLVAELKDTVEALPPVMVKYPPVRKPRGNKESVVLLCSCWHIGEVIDRQEMGGLNSYDFPTFMRRWQFMVDTIISWCTHKMNKDTIAELQVVMLGDMVSGLIHEELEITNDLTMVEQAMLGAFVTAQGLLELAQVFPKVVVTGLVGNHGRVRQQKRHKRRAVESWDRVFYETLALLTRNTKSISYHIPKSYWSLMRIQGHTFLAAHGDTVRSSLGIPFYGLKREIQQWSRIYASQGVFLEYTLLSHFHTKAALQEIGGELLMNGSLKGGDEYALTFGLYSEPLQLLFGVHPEKGKTWELRLQPKFLDPKERLRYICDPSKSLSDQL